ncbi:MAG TPA: PLP-dependent aminotransferase family protein [Polyangia bacterium]
MRNWELAIALDRALQAPLFLQIARAIEGEIRRGRLRPGDELPGSRTLADRLAVHRNTVVAAYDELAAEGWTLREAARGTFVSRDLPAIAPRRFAPEESERTVMPERPGYELGAPLELLAPVRPVPGAISLAGGMPDLRLAPVAELARAYRRALTGRRGRALLDYGDPRGQLRLRVALADMLSATRGLCASADELVVTRGSQMAIALAARALLQPGDLVAVESLGYRPAWAALKEAGARLAPLPVDGRGLDVDALAALAAKKRVRAVYLSPHHHYPTTVTLAPGRRLRLLALARAHKMVVIEDDYDHEFHYEGRPILPLASADPSGMVLYVGTLSKLLAPGLRLGYVAAPRPVINRLAEVRALVDRQGDHVLESAVASLIEEGELQRHARRTRRIYHARRDALTLALERSFGKGERRRLVYTTPPGGIALWARVRGGVDVEAWAARGLSAGVWFHTARRFAFDGRARPFVRLGFAASTESEIREAVRRMAALLPPMC